MKRSPGSRPKVIAIVGATASGKSALGEALALKYNGEIVSADSRQVYRGLDLGTGKEQLAVVQHCIDITDPEERMTVVQWREQAIAAIEDILSRGKLPIVVGGTGLYMDALIDNFTFAPEDAGGAIRSELEGLDTAVLQQRLRALSSSDEAITQSTNRRHLVRALERAMLGGHPDRQPSPYQWLVLGVERERAELYARIDQRVDDRMQQGMLDEVRGLIVQGVSAQWLRSLGLEYRYLTDYIEKTYPTLDEAVQKLKYASHHFARRQLVWWRRRADICWVSTVDQAIERTQSFISPHHS